MTKDNSGVKDGFIAKVRDFKMVMVADETNAEEILTIILQACKVVRERIGRILRDRTEVRGQVLTVDGGETMITILRACKEVREPIGKIRRDRMEALEQVRIVGQGIFSKELTLCSKVPV